MEDLIANQSTWMAEGGSRQTRACNAAFRLTVKYAARIEQAAGRVVSSQERLGRARREVERYPECRGSLAAIPDSDFELLGFALGTPSASGRQLVRTFASSTNDSLSGAYEAHAIAILEGVALTEGSTADVSAVVSSVLSSASSIPAADYLVVAAVGDLVISSAITWNDFVFPGGAYCQTVTNGDGTVSPCTEGNATSSLVSRGWMSKIGWTVISDAGGCVGSIATEGVLLGFFATNPATAPAAAGAAVAMCAYGGIFSSAVSAAAMM
jgi:hypothetical protein